MPMAKEPGFGMIFKSASPNYVRFPPGANAADNRGENWIIGDKNGEEIRCQKISLQLIMTTNIQQKDL